MLPRQKHDFTSYIFAIVGVAMVIGSAYFTLRQYDFVTHSEVTEGMVLELVQNNGSKGSTYAPRIEFKTRDNKSFTFTSNLYSSSPEYREDQVVSVRYRTDDPQTADVDSFMTIWLGPIVLLVLGLTFSLMGIILSVKRIARNRVLQGLEASNRQIVARITEVKRSSAGRRNFHPYLLFAEYEEAGKTYTFKSDPIPYDPTNMIKTPTVTVIADPSDMSKYYVDVDSAFKPQEAS